MKFERIHPFQEGNGRTTRAFMNVQLVRAELTPVYIKVEEKTNYIMDITTGTAVDLVINENKKYMKLHSVIVTTC